MAYLLNYVAGLVVFVIGIVCVSLRAPIALRVRDVLESGESGSPQMESKGSVSVGFHGSGAAAIDWLPFLALALVYVVVWTKLFAHLDGLEKDEWERSPHVFVGGAMAFLLGVMTPLVPWLESDPNCGRLPGQKIAAGTGTG
ncbi:MAG: hypothetical protein ABI330_01915 [Caldimonas sp.]